MVNLARHCPLPSHYFEPCKVTTIKLELTLSRNILSFFHEFFHDLFQALLSLFFQ